MTARQAAEAEIKKELSKSDCAFIVFGTFVDNTTVRTLVNKYLKEQVKPKEEKPSVDLIHAKAIRFRYGDNYYLAKQEGECSCIYLFNDDIMGNDAMFIKLGSTPYECKNEFIAFNENDNV